MPWREPLSKLEQRERDLEDRVDRLPDPEKIKVHTKWESLRLAAAVAVSVALVVALIFAAVLVVLHQSDKNALQTRREAVRVECVRQNSQNDKAIDYIHDFGVQTAKKTHGNLAKEERSLKPFVLLMDAAIPKQNCHQLALKLYPNHLRPFLSIP